jgi:hypothetical protein
MPTASSANAALAASVLAALAGCGPAREASEPPARPRQPSQPSVVEARGVGDSTRLDIRTASGRSYSLVVGRDSTVVPEASPAGTTVVGELTDAAVVVIDTYPSRPAGMSLCQAGEERFLRVVTLADGDRADETARVKVASCRTNLELAASGVEWLADSAAVRVSWLLGPGGTGAPESRLIRLGADGRPTR